MNVVILVFGNVALIFIQFFLYSQLNISHMVHSNFMNYISWTLKPPPTRYIEITLFYHFEGLYPCGVLRKALLFLLNLTLLRVNIENTFSSMKDVLIHDNNLRLSHVLLCILSCLGPTLVVSILSAGCTNSYQYHRQILYNINKQGPQGPQKPSFLKSLKINPPPLKNTGMCHRTIIIGFFIKF